MSLVLCKQKLSMTILLIGAMFWRQKVALVLKVDLFRSGQISFLFPPQKLFYCQRG